MVAGHHPSSLDLDQRAHRTLVLRDLLACLGQAAPSEDGGPARPLRLDLEDPAMQAYTQAWCDVLTMFGVLRWDNGTCTVVSPQAGYFIQQLRALSLAPAPLVPDWHSEGVRGDASAALELGVNLLAAFEQRRVALQPAAMPLRETRAALAVIARGSPGGRELLLVWDAAAGAWQLPGGRAERADASLRATLLRELAEELECGALAESRDVELAKLGEPFERTRLSPTYGLRTRARFQLFAVRWVADLPALPAQARWLREPELLDGRTDDGQPVAAEPYVRLLCTPGLELDAVLGLAPTLELERTA